MTAATTAFAALGDDTRWGILQRIGEQPASASAIGRDSTISRQAVSKHLEILRAAGLVETEQRGREVVYRAIGSRISELARDLDSIARQWDKRLTRIKRVAESK